MNPKASNIEKTGSSPVASLAKSKLSRRDSYSFNRVLQRVFDKRILNHGKTKLGTWVGVHQKFLKN